MADWVPAPENNPWLLPDGTRLRLSGEGDRHTTLMPATPWTPEVNNPHIDLDLPSIRWEYWSETAVEGPSDFVRGYEAAIAASLRAAERERRRSNIWSWSAWAVLNLLIAATAVTTGTWWSVALNGGLGLILAGLVARYAVQLRRMNREVRRG